MDEEQVSQNTVSAMTQPQKADISQGLQESSQQRSNKLLLTGLVFFALIVLITVGIFVFQNYQLTQKVVSRKDNIIPISAPTLIPSSIPTTVISPATTVNTAANWSEFSNKDICYTFKYPKEIVFAEKVEENVIHLSLWGPTQEKDTEFYDGISLSFSFPLQIGNVSLKDHVDSKVEETKLTGEILVPRETININGVDGYTYTSQGLGVFKNIYLQSPDKACTVEITNATNDPTDQGFQQTVDEILSTFTFVNQKEP